MRSHKFITSPLMLFSLFFGVTPPLPRTHSNMRSYEYYMYSWRPFGRLILNIFAIYLVMHRRNTNEKDSLPSTQGQNIDIRFTLQVIKFKFTAVFQNGALFLINDAMDSWDIRVISQLREYLQLWTWNEFRYLFYRYNMYEGLS